MDFLLLGVLRVAGLFLAEAARPTAAAFLRAVDFVAAPEAREGVAPRVVEGLRAVAGFFVVAGFFAVAFLAAITHVSLIITKIREPTNCMTGARWASVNDGGVFWCVRGDFGLTGDDTHHGG